jgi:hypothetical protein
MAALLLLAGACVMLPHGNFHDAGNIILFLLGATIMLIGFGWALFKKNIPLLLILITALSVRFLLLWQAPGEDIYRYIWEGKLLLHHINPYAHAPNDSSLINARDGLWSLIGQRDFSAIYPPLAEWCFALLAAFSPSVLFFKLAFVSADLLAGWLLWRCYGGSQTLFYLWNPLIIYSFAGGGHYDSFFILTLVLGWIDWEKERFARAALWIGLAIAFKWMALPLLCWMAWRIFKKQGFRAGMLMGILGLTPLLMFWGVLCFWTGEWIWHLYPAKFVEYARSAELIPRLLDWAGGDDFYQNHWFAPSLAMAWGFVIFRAKKFVTAAEWFMFLAMVLSPLVHAWYFTWLIPFAVVTRNSGTILLSASAFVYFTVYTNTDRSWAYQPWEIALLWTPFVIGFLGFAFWPSQNSSPASVLPET